MLKLKPFEREKSVVNVVEFLIPSSINLWIRFWWPKMSIPPGFHKNEAHLESKYGSESIRHDE